MADEQDDAQKTEDPTPRKLQDSRKKGQVALSRELNNWLMILMATILIGTMAPSVMGDLKDHMSSYIEHAHAYPQPPGGFSIMLGHLFKWGRSLHQRQ
jgi:flagellar biosynthetic protein FlhB